MPRSRSYSSVPVLLILLALPLTALLCSLDLRWTRTARAAPVAELTLGSSVQQRPITAVRFGAGPRKLVVVGDTHGGPEANTYVLTNQLIAYFRANPEQVPPDVRLYLIPTINPDGLALGSRFNARGVDLNRNMNTNLDTCEENDWRTHVQGAYGIESDTGGPYPDSEIEGQVIRDFLLDADGAIFLHSNAGLVFPAFCEHTPSIELGRVYAQAAGYIYNRYWPKYMITGGMHDWAGSMGIAAITPELVTGSDSEYEQNMAGLLAVLRGSERLLPAAQGQAEAGVPVPALLWRYWKSHGGTAVFGAPLAPATQVGTVTSQTFARAILELHPEQADTPFLVQPVALGAQSLRALGNSAQPPGSCELAPGPCALFPETGHTLRQVFQTFWERHDGRRVFGLPVSEEFDTLTADGQRRTVQYFERAVFAYYPEDGSVRPEPLGWAALVQQRVGAAVTAASAR